MHTLEGKNLEFSLEQHDKELQERCFSPSFSLELLPGMYSMPIGVVPKPHSSGLHLVTDNSAGDYVLNSFITCVDASIKLDDLQDFGSILQVVITEHGCTPAWLFKSNVAAAYRCIPMHPLWQIKQVNTFQGLHHINQNMAFKTHTAPRIWCSFFALVMWIAIHIYSCLDLLHYMDDMWSYDMDSNLIYYQPYDSWFPRKQVKLLLSFMMNWASHTSKKNKLLVDLSKLSGCS